MHQEESLWLRERYELSLERVREIGSGTVPMCSGAYEEYFKKCSGFILYLSEIYEMLQSGEYDKKDMAELSDINRRLFQDIMPENYGECYGNPAYACEQFSESYGGIFSWLYTEIRALIPMVFRDRLSDICRIVELFLEIHGEMHDGLPEVKVFLNDIYWYISDYAEETLDMRARERLDPSMSFFRDIIMNEDLSDPAYLYKYGLSVSDTDLEISKYLAAADQDFIDRMAETFVEGYVRGFEITRADFSAKKNVQLVANIGFERVLRSVIEKFESYGKECILYGMPYLSVNRLSRNMGLCSVSINPQYDFDHRRDAGLYLDSALVDRICACSETVYEKYRELADALAGPARMEVFGEEPFQPAAKKENISLSPKQEKLLVKLNGRLSEILNRYIDQEAISFSIIAWPLPSIGDIFEDVMRETLIINTLDNDEWSIMQQKMIDAMDGAKYVHVLGAGDNRTDIKIALRQISDPSAQTVFGNCCADVNIPLGEMFTSPVLKGTDGILHVSQVYLSDISYKDLMLKFEDGFVRDYRCANFESEEENRKFIKDNLLQHHDSLPMGEFAIGTNTAAYSMAGKYGISNRLPILIMEKTGPHFAIGDTCYSHCEDKKVYNPDGKEIISRENECSELRSSDPEKAYFNIHTDITIPFEEIKHIKAVFEDGRESVIIEDGRFCLAGTEKLNSYF